MRSAAESTRRAISRYESSKFGVDRESLSSYHRLELSRVEQQIQSLPLKIQMELQQLQL